MKNKETLEEVAEKWFKEIGRDASFIKAIEFGAKWKQEQDKKLYSELVDLLERLTTIYKEDSDLHQKYDKQRLNLIEQFKKKYYEISNRSN